MDLSGCPCTHLDESHLVGGVESEDHERYTDMVVEVALGGKEVVLAREDGADELLRRRLTVGARDADDRDVKLSAVMGGKGLKCRQRIFDKKATRIGGCHVLINDGIGRPLFKSTEAKSLPSKLAP